jgi:hypothetical protein
MKKDKEQENHVVAIKNKLYDNSALELSTQRSSTINGQHPNDIVKHPEDSTMIMPGNSSTGMNANKYRTDSAQVFRLKPPLMRISSGRTQQVERHGGKFTGGGRPPAYLQNNESFINNYKSYGNSQAAPLTE